MATQRRRSDRYPLASDGPTDLHPLGLEHAEPLEDEEGRPRPVAVDQSAPQSEPQPPAYELAPEIEDIAAELYRTEERDLGGCEIVYLFTTLQRKRRGRVVRSMTSKANPLLQFWVEQAGGDPPDFLVVIDKREWLAHTATKWRSALVDHALAYIGQKTDTEGNTTWIIRPPAGMFPEVIRCHGVDWDEDVAAVAAAILQPALPGMDTTTAD